MIGRHRRACGSPVFGHPPSNPSITEAHVQPLWGGLTFSQYTIPTAAKVLFKRAFGRPFAAGAAIGIAPILIARSGKSEPCKRA